MSVHSRDDRWVAKVWADGSWRWIGTYSTRKEARSAEQAARPSRSWGITVDDFCERWPRDYARPALSTRRNNGYSLNAFRREFGSRRRIPTPQGRRRLDVLSEAEVLRLPIVRSKSTPNRSERPFVR